MVHDNSQHIDDVWHLWKKYKDEQSANELIKHYMYIVHFHVERIASYIPRTFDKNDLISLGLMGLYDALNKFEPDRNLKFDTYATIRIRGAIIDGLRKEDWLPRTLREQSKKIEQASETLKQTLARKPTSKEIARQVNMTSDEVETIIMDTLFANVLSIDSIVHTTESGDNVSLSSTLKDDQMVAPEQFMLDTELNTDLIRGIKQLNENEQLVISLFYNEELTLTEIGNVLNLTTSRISQIHKRAIFKLGDILRKMNSAYAQ